MPKGIIIASGFSISGCTTVTAAIAATLKYSKFSVKAMKPLVFKKNLNETKFLALVTKDTNDYRISQLDSFKDSSRKELEKIKMTCEGFVQPIILDTPAPLATPLLGLKSNFDICDFSLAMDWPLVLISYASVNLFNNLKLSMDYALAKKTKILGMIGTSPYENTDYEEREEDLNYLSSLYGIPALGILRYSPSISINELNQGNIIKLTSANIDLLPIQQALDLSITVGEREIHPDE